MVDSKRLFLVLVIMVVCAACDQSTKLLASSLLEPGRMLSYAGDTFRLQYSENRGAFLGLGGQLSEQTRFWLFIILVAVILLAVFLYTLFDKTLGKFNIVALSVILGGGASNLYDRIANNGAVVDFMNMGIGQVRTGIFNVADMFIMTGAVMLLVYAIFQKEEAA